MPVEEKIWDAPEHTRAKHKILKSYLDAWAPIMSQQSARSKTKPPLYIDAFAGPGTYKDGHEGSPVIAIKAILDHSHEIPSPIRMNFIEADRERHQILSSKLAPVKDRDHSRVVVEHVMNTTCEEGVLQLIDAEAKNFGSFGPAFVFLDQFGYSQAPMQLIGKVMAGVSCEVLIYLDYRRMNHTLTDPNKEKALHRTFGSRGWEKARNLDGDQRIVALRDSYKKALSLAGAEYVWDFEMRGERNELLSWLFFCTSNHRGLEEMKKAMYRLDLTGNFRFSDRYVNQLNLLEEIFDMEWLAAHLSGHFGGSEVRFGAIQRYVLTETPLISFKKALAQLERTEKLEVPDPPPNRRLGSFNFESSVPIKFLSSPRGQLPLF